MSARRPIRIGNASGAIGDGLDQVYRLASSGVVDAITADYLAEFNIAWKAIELQHSPHLGYEPNFLQQLAYNNGAGARAVAERNIKVVHDGGALNPKGLAEKADEYFRSLGITHMKIAWVEGDNVTSLLQQSKLGELNHLDLKGHVFDAKNDSEVLAANIYTGQAGIVKALEQGADIVICGRCCDASPVMGLAYWWHGWKDTDYQRMAGSLMAGHLIECGPYVTGGNYCGQFEVPEMHHVGFPIAEIAHDGTCEITKQQGSNGVVTVDTCKGQLLYEIQGPVYLNPNVTAFIDNASLVQVSKDRVRLTGIVGHPPPATAKLAICSLGGYQAEISAYAAGLDTDYKFSILKDQVTRQINPADFTTFSIEKYGSAPANPRSQKDCTVQYRLFAQSKRKEAFDQFRKAVFYNGMQGFCGLHLGMDWRTMEPKPFVEYFPALIKQNILPELKVCFVSGQTHRVSQVPPQTLQQHDALGGQAAARRQAGSSTPRGQMVKRPLGDLVFARSGDKGGNANVGFWVRDASAYSFLQELLTTDKMVELLADDWDPKYTVERCDFPNLHAVHFLVKGILQKGVSSSSVLDGFAKSFGEFLRARVVEMPADLVRAEDDRRQAAMRVGPGARL